MKRRLFLQAVGYGGAGLTLLGSSTHVRAAQAAVTPRGSAKNVIFVHLSGAPSHIDTFDLKLGSWTPDDFGPSSNGNIQLASGLFPNLIDQADKFSLLRCISGTEAVHSRANYVLETAHTFNPTFSKEQPHFGSLLAYELEGRRKSDDIMPGFLSINGLTQGQGLLSSRYAPFAFSSEDGVPGLEHPGGQQMFEKRYQSLLALDPNRNTTASKGSAISDYHGFYDLGQGLMYQPDITAALTVSEEEQARYGDSQFGNACALAVKSIAVNRGTRVVQVSHGGWDHHNDIYDRNNNGNLYDRTAELDPGLAALLLDLAALPGEEGDSLLDETLVVATGEFGRTPGAITNNLGRDHYQYAWSGLVAGGGITPGQNFGATDDEGWGIIDPFWSQNRTITMNDLIATIYSSMGVDWTKEIEDTPSGRVFEYTPKYNGEAGYYKDIVEMFR